MMLIPQHIFAENVTPPTIVPNKLPETDKRLINTPQLAYCLSLLKASHHLLDDNILEPTARNWLQAIEKDDDEQERLKMLATDVIRAYKRDELKDAKTVTEIVSLSPALDKDTFRDLLSQFYDGVAQSDLLNFHQLDGLAQLIQGADDPGYLDADDLVKILGLINTRLSETHKQSPRHIYQLTATAARVLDAMADTNVTGLDREKLHEPLTSYMDGLKGSSDPYLVYQAAYAYQALLCVPDDETLWQATLRRTGKVIKGVSGLVSAVKGLDLKEFIDGLMDIQQGITGAKEVVQLVKTAYKGMENGVQFMNCLKEGLSFQRKSAWYPALRGADALIRDGEFASFKKLICEAPCRLDPAFQWGVCQRLGEIAANSTWDTHIRRNAVAFLGEIYRNDVIWGQQLVVKEWILDILTQLSLLSESALQVAESLLQELKSTSDTKDQTLGKKDSIAYLLKVTLPTLGSPSLLDRVQNKPDVESNLRQLRKQRVKERGDTVYIQPQAKPNLQASDDTRFPLMENVKEFLNSHQKVFLLLGDSGAGKSTFHKTLEYDLWQSYKKNTGIIPLHINLPAIDKPEQDMIAKQLRKAEFTEPEIRELKIHRKFILICDGYDESQQTHNLYVSNRLNQPREWIAQMIISCRSEYIGVDYRHRFQPGDRNNQQSAAASELFQEAVMMPFSEDQVEDYIDQYVIIRQPLWEAKEYKEALDLIPSLNELVKNPFLMTLSLEVLPRIVDPGQPLSLTRVTRMALYDQFIEHWLERGKKRLSEKELSPLAKAAFDSLVDEGFTQNGIDFLKKLAVAIYKEQDGQPIINYSRFKDENSWKAAFFSREDEKQLLREACPLTRSGNQHRFVHRSLLEYGLALAIFDPKDWKEKQVVSGSVLVRRRSTSSVYSFDMGERLEEKALSLDQEKDKEKEGPDLNSPLAWRYYVNEPSLLQFLEERVQQEPIFKQQLLSYIEHSKSNKKWRTAAANAITILVRAGEQFIGTDLRGIRIPGADLSYGMFDSAQLQGADLRRAHLRNIWLRQADLSGAQMSSVQFGEQPFLKQDSHVHSCAYSPDGKAFAVGLGRGDINVYDTSSWDTVWTLKGLEKKGVSGIMFSPNSNRIASGSSTTVRLWDFETGLCINTFTGHEDSINDVAYSQQGDRIASASGDKTVRVWNVETGECLHTLTGHTDQIWSVAFSPNGNQIASSSADCRIRLWDAETGICSLVLNPESWHVMSVIYSPRGEMVASGGMDDTISLWDVETGTCRCNLSGHSDSVNSVAFSPQGDLIASASNDNTVRLWDIESETCRQVFTGHTDFVRSVVFSPEGDHIASGSSDTNVRMWDLRIETSHHVSNDQRSKALILKYSEKVRQVATGFDDGMIQLRDVDTGTCLQTLWDHDDTIRSIVFSTLGDTLASASDDQTVRLWDVKTGTCHRILTDPDNRVSVVMYSPRGDQVASGNDYGTLRLWDVETGQCRLSLEGHTRPVAGIAYSLKGGDQNNNNNNNNNIIITGSWDKTLRLWNAETGDYRILTGHDDIINSIAYSPHGDLVASASDDKTVRLWDVETGVCRHVLSGHVNMIPIVTYSPRGDQVASGDEDGLVKLWGVETGECLHTLNGHSQGIATVAYSSKGELVASGSGDSTVRIWDVVSGQCRAVLQEFQSTINDIVWSSSSSSSSRSDDDVNYFMTGCDDGSVRQWRLIEDGVGGSGGGDQCLLIRLCWSSKNDALTVKEASIQGVRGLSQPNKQLLKQLGSVGEPFHPFRESSNKLITMASVISKLKLEDEANSTNST